MGKISGGIMLLLNDGIIIGSRKGYILDSDDKYYYVVYTHQRKGGKFVPFLSDKIWKIQKEFA